MSNSHDDMVYEGRYVLIGPPGTGKTTFLKRQVERIVERTNVLGLSMFAPPVMVTSLTKTAASEIAGRVNLPRGAVGTLHSHAYKALNTPDVVDNKTIDDWNRKHPRWRISEDSLGGGALDSDDVAIQEIPLPDDFDGDKALAEVSLLRNRMTPIEKWPLGLRTFHQTFTAWKDEKELVDFTDIIDYARAEYPPEHIKIILADEAQDLSALEYDLLSKWADAAGCLIIVGDPWQALYTWRGAHPEIFTDQSIPQDRRKVLSQSYRVPKAVHASAMTLARSMGDYTDIEYKPRTGTVGSTDNLPVTVDDTRRLVILAMDTVKNGESIMFQTTCAYQLQNLIRDLKKAGVPVSNPWRKSRNDWNPLSAGKTSTMRRFLYLLKPTMWKYRGSDWNLAHDNWTWKDIESWIELIQVSKVFKRGVKKRVSEMAEALGDKPLIAPDLISVLGDEFLPVIEMMEDADGKGLVEWAIKNAATRRKNQMQYISKIIDNFGLENLDKISAASTYKNVNGGACYVGTIHSFKGGEAGTTIVFPDLSRAARAEWQSGVKGRDSILRSFYVAFTRSMNMLYLASPASAIPMDFYGLLRKAIKEGKKYGEKTGNVPF